MRKFLYSIFLFIITLFPISVFAEGYISVSQELLTIEQGESKIFTIEAFNAIGDVYIESNNSDIAMVRDNEWGTGIIGDHEMKYGNIFVNGVNVGTTEIILTIDGATFDYDDLSEQVKTITINVVPKKLTNIEESSIEEDIINDNTLNEFTIYNSELEKNNNDDKLEGNNIDKIDKEIKEEKQDKDITLIEEDKCQKLQESNEILEDNYIAIEETVFSNENFIPEELSLWDKILNFLKLCFL